ncbi:MAG: gamma carbonic anhydrase family protein [Verrucomicrobiota bacterium]
MTVEERLEKFLGKDPQIEEAAFVAPNATVIGDVRLSKNVSVWYQCVLRADINSIVVGEGSNIQDGVVVHLADHAGVTIGRHCTIGHSAIIHACSLGDECLVGMGATVLDHANIGSRSIIGANSLVTRGMEIPEGSLVYGSPAKVVKTLDEEAQSGLIQWAEKYIKVAQAHAEKFKT